MAVEPEVARRRLPQLAAWAAHPIIRPPELDSPAQRELRELKRQHAAAPVLAVEAYAQAAAVLERQGGGAAFGQWRISHGGWAGYWPTVQGRSRRDRVRAVDSTSTGLLTGQEGAA